MSAAPGDREAPRRPLALTIEGMHCQSCVATIERALAALPGVADSRVSLALEEARLRYHPEQLETATILEAIRATGYTASVRESDPGSGLREQAEDERIRADATRRQVAVGLGLSAFVMVLSMGPARFGLPDFPGRLAGVALATAIVLVYVGGGCFRRAWLSARRGQTHMDTLVALGAGVAFFYSLTVWLLDLPRDRFPVYFESAAMIVTLVTLGKHLEARARSRAGHALRSLLEGQPEHALLRREGEFVEVALEEVRAGDRVLIRPGATVPVDGVVVEGRSHVDESTLTGESRPVAKAAGDSVYAGTLNGEGALHCDVEAAGGETALDRLVERVREAQSTRAPIQSRADAIAGFFVPVVLVVACAVALAWFFVGAERFYPEQHPLATALVFAAATLLISCPCAMGLATPLALIAGTGEAARRGLLIKNAAALERAAGATHVLFDKTGTLTEGRHRLISIHPEAGDEKRLLVWAASVEHDSEHPIARALREAARERGMELPICHDFAVHAGRGVEGLVEGRRVRVGRLEFVTRRDGLEAAQRAAAALTEAGRSVVGITVDGTFQGTIAFGDVLRPESLGAIRRLRAMGLEIGLLSGDAPPTARAIGRELGLDADHVEAGVLPEDKARIVEKFRSRGGGVAMVGDGINDAAALAAADIGIAVGSGTDLALESADIVLVGSDLSGVVAAFETSRRTLRTIRQNLFWAFAYNVAAIPLAAGLLVPWLGAEARLQPAVAAGAMAASSLFVALNSLRAARARRS